jgi:hypothetical protein
MACAQPFAHVAVAGHDHDLAREHDVGGAHDAVRKRVAAAVEVVELRLGDRVVDVDAREQQFALGGHLVQAVHAGGGLFRDALDVLGGFGEESGTFLDGLLHLGVQDPSFFMAGVDVKKRRVLLGAQSKVDKKRQVAAVVQDHVGGAVVGPLQDLPGVVPVFFQRFALGGEHGDAVVGDGRCGVVLGAEDVAGAPADVGAQFLEGLDQHGGLDGHVQ